MGPRSLMKVNFISIESSRPKWASEAFHSYEKRFNNSLKINWIGLKPPKRDRNYNVPDIVEREKKLLTSRIKKNDYVITLDKDGKNLTTENFKLKFEEWTSFSKDISFIVGGPDGLSPKLITDSNFCMSLSKLTFPHSMVPIIAIEQLYRVWSMTQNHPYHK